MSYPAPRYHGASGEASATIRRADHPPELATATGFSSYLATGATTNGEFGLYRWDMGPEPSGPGPHFHRTMSESFFVLSGTVRIFDGTAWVDTHPGDFTFVPEGGVHGFRNDSDAAATMLILFAPGAPRVTYFRQLADTSSSGRVLSDEEWTDLFARHDQYRAT